MAIRNVVQEGDEILRKVCKPVEVFDERLFKLLDDMKDTVKKERGAGLAGPQIGVLKRVCVVDVDEGYFEFINPKIVAVKGKQKGVEGCLSVRHKQGYVTRPNIVTLQYQDRNGTPHEITATGFFARACCHETDHLDGVLYIDKASEVWLEK
jgi:peptide deformylase